MSESVAVNVSGRNYSSSPSVDMSHPQGPAGSTSKSAAIRCDVSIPEGISPGEVPSGVVETLDVTAYHNWKRLWEFPVALLLAPPALLLAGILAIVVRCTSPGNGVYSQVRSGRNGKPFTMYKLRSMKIDAESQGIQWCEGERDPRITPLGYWLRKLHLDELPQIINVLRGDMSFCGPRPERPEIVEELEKVIPYYQSRLTIRPGITGFSQINLPADSDTGSVLKKQTLDLEYVENASLLYDFAMVACTALRLVGVPGSIATKLAGLTKRPEDSRFAFYYQDLWNKIEEALAKKS